MAIGKAVQKQVSDELQAYVYMLVDPDYGVPFYVGRAWPAPCRHLAEAINPVEESPEDESR